MTASPPYRLTREELRNIAANADSSISSGATPSPKLLHRMRAKMLLNHAGVPEHLHPKAATEASYRVSFSQETEALTSSALGGTILKVVKEDKLGRQPFPQHLMRH